MNSKISNLNSVKLSALEDVLNEMPEADAEFIGRMTQCELDGEAITCADIARIAQLYVEYCE